MNREILFRGKRRDNGEWVYGDLQIGESNVIIATKGRRILYEVQADTVGQYTGLTDKNGNKIFEGDIIALNPRRFANNRVFYYIRCSGFYLTKSMEEPKTCDIKPFSSDDCDRYVVIGNIHDNPELLEGGNV